MPHYLFYEKFLLGLGVDKIFVPFDFGCELCRLRFIFMIGDLEQGFVGFVKGDQHLDSVRQNLPAVLLDIDIDIDLGVDRKFVNNFG